MTDLAIPVTLRLKKREARRIVAGHPWVFANEVESLDPPNAESGLCRVTDDSKRFIGTGYFNKHSLICSRLLTRDPNEVIDSSFFADRLRSAFERRQSLYEPSEAFRWVFGEADALPGLVVDRYPGLVVVQVSTLGMEQLQSVWEPAVRELASDSKLLFRNDTAARAREGLSEDVCTPDGQPPNELAYTESGAPAVALPLDGQKTGSFLDQRENRIWARRLARGAQVLDLFCYTGAWGFSLLHAGATKVTFVDQSQTALDAATRSAERSGVATRTSFFRGDASDFLQNALEQKAFYDFVIADPPAFIPSKKAFAAGRRGYLNLFRNALALTSPGGYAALSSCSFHLSDQDFEQVVTEAATRARRTAEILWRGGAGPDHPQPVTFPEAHYLKCVFLRVY